MRTHHTGRWFTPSEGNPGFSITHGLLTQRGGKHNKKCDTVGRLGEDATPVAIHARGNKNRREVGGEGEGGAHKTLVKKILGMASSDTAQLY